LKAGVRVRVRVRVRIKVHSLIIDRGRHIVRSRESFGVRGRINVRVRVRMKPP
jgi:hypothetical protein